jgi:hypothetical protein
MQTDYAVVLCSISYCLAAFRPRRHPRFEPVLTDRLPVPERIPGLLLRLIYAISLTKDQSSYVYLPQRIGDHTRHRSSRSCLLSPQHVGHHCYRQNGHAEREPSNTSYTPIRGLGDPGVRRRSAVRNSDGFEAFHGPDVVFLGASRHHALVRK